ncbi:MAG: DNA-binding response regulator [Planctomycetota bacterium]|nr:MAG: DNA-binding response regulator [Planctomycetota bacterium]
MRSVRIIDAIDGPAIGLGVCPMFEDESAGVRMIDSIARNTGRRTKTRPAVLRPERDFPECVSVSVTEWPCQPPWPRMTMTTATPHRFQCATAGFFEVHGVLLVATEGTAPGSAPHSPPSDDPDFGRTPPVSERAKRGERPDHAKAHEDEPRVEGTVFVVEDDQPLARSLKWWLEKIPGVQVRTFGSAEEFLERFDPTEPGCVLSDVRMGGMDGLQLQRELRRRAPDAVMVLMSGYADVPMAVQAVSDGAFDFVEKPIDRPALRRIIIDAIREDARRRQQRAEIEHARAMLKQLSQRERQVLELLVAGKSNREVADELAVSEKTVESHRSRIRSKLGVDSLAEMVRVYVLATREENG